MSNPLSNTNFMTVNAGLTEIVPATASFDEMLILDNTGVITQAQRVQQYSSVAQVLSAGFSSNSPAVLQAQLYFSQSPSPDFLWIGAQDPTAIETIAVHSGNAGTGYTLNDVVTISHASATGASAKVTGVNAGVVTTLQLLTQGTGYPVSTANTTTGGTGTGLEVDIAAIGETCLQALTACRAASAGWYVCFASTAIDADHTAIAAWAEAQSTPTVYAIGTSEAAVLNGTAGNVAATLQSATYQHTSVQYCNSATAASNTYAPVAQWGQFLANNTQSQIAAFKNNVGVVPEPITQTNFTTLNGLNVNVVAAFQGGTFFTPGLMSGGFYMDERLGIDLLVADIQSSVFAEFINNPKVAQTNDGESLFINAVVAACQRGVDRGFIAPASTWNGIAIPVLGLSTGDALSKGFRVGAPSFTTQSSSDRSARRGMPVTVVVGLAGAIQNLVVNVTVQR